MLRAGAIDLTYDNPEFFILSFNSKKYRIEHSNNFDSLNRISFILINIINILSNEYTLKIKYKTRKDIISTQIWFTASKEKL